jgi:hypothetical protein
MENRMLTIKYRSFSSLYIQLKHRTDETKDEENIRNRVKETGEVNKIRSQKFSREGHKNSFQTFQFPKDRSSSIFYV